VEHIHSSGDQPWDTEKTIECTCGETFETEADGKAHIKEKATGVTADQYRAIANEAKGTTLYGFKCLGLDPHTYTIRWCHETLDLTVFAKPDHGDTNGIVVQVMTEADAIEITTDTIPVTDVTDLTPQEYIDAVDEWLLDNLVNNPDGDEGGE